MVMGYVRFTLFFPYLANEVVTTKEYTHED